MAAHDPSIPRPKLSRSLSSPDTSLIPPQLSTSGPKKLPRVTSPKEGNEQPSAPPRPPRHPARSSISPSYNRKPSSKKRPSTATGTREEVTPWELFPPPDIDKPAVLLKPWPDLTSSKQESKSSSNVGSPPSSSSHSMSIANFILRRRKSSGNKNGGTRRNKTRSNTIPQVVPSQPSTPHDVAVAGPSNPPITPSLFAAKFASSQLALEQQTVESGTSLPGPSQLPRSGSSTPIRHSVSASSSLFTSLASPSQPFLPSSSSMAIQSHSEFGTRPQHPPNNQGKDAKFSTADRTILEELKRNIDAKASQFVVKGGPASSLAAGFAGRGGRHHPYSKDEVPYPRNYGRDVLDFDVWETVFCQQMCGSVTWHVFETPPTKVLDLGCGTGSWILDCARKWRDCHFVGLDVVPLHPNLQQLGSADLAARVTWVQANFLEGLPFPNEEFDYVHVKRIARGVPEDKWDALLEEITRVMKPGAAFEMMEEDLFFPGKLMDDGATDSESEDVKHRSRANTILSWRASDILEQGTEVQDTVREDDGSSQDTGSGSASVSHETDSNALSTPRTSTVALSSTPNYGVDAFAKYDDDLTPREEIPSLPRAEPKLPTQDRKSLPQLHVQINSSASPVNTTNNQHEFPSRLVSRSAFADSAISLLNSVSKSSLISSPTYSKPPSNHSRKNLPPTSPVSPSSIKSPDHDSVYHPLLRTLPKPPINPRDHTLLELIYNEMHAARFINLSPLSLLANSLGLYFKDVRTHAPLQWTFPPRRIRRGRQPATSSVNIRDSDTSSDDEVIERRPLRLQQNPQRVGAPVKRRRAATLGSQPIGSEDARITVDTLMHGESKYISIDQTQIPAYSPSSKASFPSPVRDDHNRSHTPVGPREPSVHLNTSGNATAAHQSRLPNQTLNLDHQSLNLHLAIRASEVIACAEAMWEWVLDYQAKVPKPRLLSSLHESANMYESALADLTREDFDYLLSKFDMDMQDHISLGGTMQERYGWATLPVTPTADRKAFDTAWENWCQWQRQQNPTHRVHARGHASNPSVSSMSHTTGARSRGSGDSAGVLRSGSQSGVDESVVAVRRSGSLTHSIVGYNGKGTKDKRRFSHYDDGHGGLKRSGSLLQDNKSAREKQLQHQDPSNGRRRRNTGVHQSTGDHVPPPESRLSRVTRVFVAWKP